MHKPTQSKARARAPTPMPMSIEQSMEWLMTDRENALSLLHASVATEVRCVAEVVRYALTAPNASRKLIEDILAVQEEHAAELVGVLRAHSVAK